MSGTSYTVICIFPFVLCLHDRINLVCVAHESSFTYQIIYVARENGIPSGSTSKGGALHA